MQEAQHPNRLKMLLAIAGLNQREVARESGIPEGTLRHYVAGEQVVPRRDRVKLAQVIGCGIQDLAPQYDIQGDMPKKLAPRYIMTDERIKGVSSFEEWDGCFAFGRLKTTSMVLDGDGTEAYFPANIHTHYDPQPAVFFDEVMQAKKQIQQEQEEKQQNGEPHQWNGQKYHLSKIVISREPIHEDMTLGLWLKPRDHYTGLATRRCLDNLDFRKKYVPDDWSAPVTGFSCSVGVDITAISSDGYVLLTQRGQNQSVHQNMFHCSVSEGVSPSLDRSTASQAPDLYRCACRGISEELGIHEPTDFSVSDIQFLSFSVDTHYALYGLRGTVKMKKSAEEILRIWHAGVKDKMENKKILAIPFTPEEVCSFVFSHEPFSPGGLICLYHALVHEFGREQANTALSRY
jgi:transcriptional regulator with XRE-family HTH domain